MDIALFGKKGASPKGGSTGSTAAVKTAKSPASPVSNGTGKATAVSPTGSSPKSTAVSPKTNGQSAVAVSPKQEKAVKKSGTDMDEITSVLVGKKKAIGTATATAQKKKAAQPTTPSVTATTKSEGKTETSAGKSIKEMELDAIDKKEITADDDAEEVAYEHNQPLAEDMDDSDATFESLGLIPELCEACHKMGFKKPTKIQRESIPVALTGIDVIGLAQTGSGKTAAFALPVLQALMKNPQPYFACVMSPTRELAIQIAKQFEALGSIIGVRSAVIVGGVDIMSQAVALAKKPHIIVGSPGRIWYHLENTKGFSLKSLKYLVMDEADRLLNRDFEEEINKILAVIPKQRNTFLFSATMTRKVEKLQRASLVNPVRVEVSNKYATVNNLVQNYMFIPAKYKDCYLVYLLNELSGNSAIIFVATRKETERIAILLRTLGFGAVPLHGQLNQDKRMGSLNKFTAGERPILIATDVASRYSF